MLKALISTFARIEDPRCGWKITHRLSDIPAIAVCAVLAEAESFEDIALYGRCKAGPEAPKLPALTGAQRSVRCQGICCVERCAGTG